MKARYLAAVCAVVAAAAAGCGRSKPAAPDPREPAIAGRISHLRDLPDGEWARAVGQLAGEIQALAPGASKQRLIVNLSNRVTEGDAGQETLQTVADTLASVAPGMAAKQRPFLFETLASLARYEHVRVTLDDPGYRAAMAKLQADDLNRLSPRFTLRDLQGKAWSLEALRGQVVLVNFWATWCPPCRKEMPDMQALYERFGPRGFAVLAVSDDDAGKVRNFVAARKYTFPVLLDPEKAVTRLFAVEGIPKSFLYGRDGKLVAQAIDRRTSRQFLEMLKLAGLE